MHESRREDPNQRDFVLNEFIYRRTAELFRRGRGPVVFDPESAMASEIESRVEAMQVKDIDPIRIAVVSSKAQIDHSHSVYLPREAGLEDIRDQA